MPPDSLDLLHQQLREIQKQLRRLRWRHQSIAVRQTARKAFDLTGFGHDAVERIGSAVLLAAAFFGTSLAAAQVLPTDRNTRLVIAAGGFVSVMLVSSVLVLWGYDTQLAREKEEVVEAMAPLQDEEDRLAEEVRIREAESAAHEEEMEDERERRERNRKQACPYCGAVVSAHAAKCRHCGEFLDEDLREERLAEMRGPAFSPGVAAVLSFIIPGLGQMYKGYVLSGFAWMVIVYVGYLMLCFPGFVMHVICIFAAASGDPYRRR